MKIINNVVFALVILCAHDSVLEASAAPMQKEETTAEIHDSLPKWKFVYFEDMNGQQCEYGVHVREASPAIVPDNGEYGGVQSANHLTVDYSAQRPVYKPKAPKKKVEPETASAQALVQKTAETVVAVATSKK